MERELLGDSGSVVSREEWSLIRVVSRRGESFSAISEVLKRDGPVSRGHLHGNLKGERKLSDDLKGEDFTNVTVKIRGGRSLIGVLKRGMVSPVRVVCHRGGLKRGIVSPVSVVCHRGGVSQDGCSCLKSSFTWKCDRSRLHKRCRKKRVVFHTGGLKAGWSVVRVVLQEGWSLLVRVQ